ncbi:TPA: hypothetical protein TY768_001679 [Streptococcus suis]|nr:hypothetical protein [Streptococcus suis]
MARLKFFENLIDGKLSKFIELGVEGFSEIINIGADLEKIFLPKNGGRTTFQSKDEAYQFFNECVERAIDQLNQKISQFDAQYMVEELMIWYTPLARLSLRKLNGKLNFESEKTNFPKIYKCLSYIDNTDEIAVRTLFITFSTYLALQKKAIDVLINLNLVRLSEEKNLSIVKKPSVEELADILEFSWGVARLHEIFQMVSKESNFSVNTIYIENGSIFYENSKEFSVLLATNTAYKDFSYPVKDDELQQIYDLYGVELGFSPEKIANTFKNTLEEKVTLDCKSKEELKKMINLAKNTVTLKGMLELLSNVICLEYSKQNRRKFIFDNQNKLSAKGIVKIREEYLFNWGTITSFCIRISNDLLNPDFLRKNRISNKNISSYLAHNFIEKWLLNFKTELEENDVWCEININNFEQVFDFNNKRGITKEIDFILFNESTKELIIGEYKNWQDVSFNFIDVTKEKYEIKRVKDSHEQLLRILESDLQKTGEFLGLDLKGATLKLVNIFENRNITCDNENYFTRVEFEAYCKRNLSSFKKRSKNDQSLFPS